MRLTGLALEQSEAISKIWEPQQRDCAGFVRFLYREAVTGRAEMWKNSEGKNVAFLTGRDLIQNNFAPVKDDSLETGDVLLFNRPNQPASDAWHMMVVLKSPHEFQKRLLVIYHNGEKGLGGAIRKVWWEDLRNSPFSEWRPEKSNPNYVGHYRWKGWL